MKSASTIQERLEDLRKENHLSLEELSDRTGISSSTLSNYETDEYKSINHDYLIKLADFYGVSLDYLFCLTENKKESNSEISELRLSDEVIDLLKSGRINSRLLSEIISHKDFAHFLADAEIYVDGIAAMRIKDLNAMLDGLRYDVMARNGTTDSDHYLETLEKAQIDEDDYFCHITHGTMDGILRDIRRSHEKDIENMPNTGTTAQNIMKDAALLAKKGGTPEEYLCQILCTALGVDFSKLPDDLRQSVQKLVRRSPSLKQLPHKGKRW